MLKRWFVIAGVCGLLLLGCTDPDQDQGVVARVNGQPITLTQVEAEHDLLQLEGEDSFGPSLEKLKQEYGHALSKIIVQKLIQQELVRQNLAVSDEEVQNLEQDIRTDYPDGAFEQVLIEEYISLDLWRERLKAKLSYRKFVDRILRPAIQVDYQEAEAYYLEHEPDFYIPAQYTLTVVRGENQELVSQARDRIVQDKGVAVEEVVNGPVSVNTVTLREDRMPDVWQERVRSLEPGQASEVFGDDSEFQAFFVLEREEAVFLDPSQAYPLIEEILIEQKLNNAFQQWLEQTAAASRIEVSTYLLSPDDAAQSGQAHKER